MPLLLLSIAQLSGESLRFPCRVPRPSWENLTLHDFAEPWPFVESSGSQIAQLSRCCHRMVSRRNQHPFSLAHRCRCVFSSVYLLGTHRAQPRRSPIKHSTVDLRCLSRSQRRRPPGLLPRRCRPSCTKLLCLQLTRPNDIY